MMDKEREGQELVLRMRNKFVREQAIMRSLKDHSQFGEHVLGHSGRGGVTAEG
jgi:hypothetical protein